MGVMNNLIERLRKPVTDLHECWKERKEAADELEEQRRRRTAHQEWRKWASDELERLQGAIKELNVDSNNEIQRLRDENDELHELLNAGREYVKQSEAKTAKLQAELERLQEHLEWHQSETALRDLVVDELQAEVEGLQDNLTIAQHDNRVIAHQHKRDLAEYNRVTIENIKLQAIADAADLAHYCVTTYLSSDSEWINSVRQLGEALKARDKQ